MALKLRSFSGIGQVIELFFQRTRITPGRFLTKGLQDEKAVLFSRQEMVVVTPGAVISVCPKSPFLGGSR